MTSAFDTPGPGRNVSILRRQRGMTQPKLAREAGVSVSLLSKIEIGDRALSPGVASALARAMGITLDEVLGEARVAHNDETSLCDLRATIRRFELPGEPPLDPETLHRELADLSKLRGDADLSGVLRKLPAIVAQATNHAHAVGSPQAWGLVANVYSTVYWLAARQNGTPPPPGASRKRSLKTWTCTVFNSARRTPPRTLSRLPWIWKIIGRPWRWQII